MKKILVFLLTIIVSTLSFAQTAEFITEMLSTDEATFGQVCYLSAVYQNLISEENSEIDAVNVIFEQGILPRNVDSETKINYKQVAALLCRIWDIKGGLLYRALKNNPRYSLKQLKHDGVVSSNINPRAIPSGVDILNIFTLGEMKYANGAKK